MTVESLINILNKLPSGAEINLRVGGSAFNATYVATSTDAHTEAAHIIRGLWTPVNIKKGIKNWKDIKSVLIG